MQSASASETAAAKAHAVGRWAETMSRALSSRHPKRWKFISFRDEGGGESRGVVDILAIRKNTCIPDDAALKAYDLFDIVLVQCKGESSGYARLQCTAEHLVARGEGGPDCDANIVAACAHCNRTRHKRISLPKPEAYRQDVAKRVKRGAWHQSWVYANGLLKRDQSVAAASCPRTCEALLRA